MHLCSKATCNNFDPFKTIFTITDESGKELQQCAYFDDGSGKCFAYSKKENCIYSDVQRLDGPYYKIHKLDSSDFKIITKNKSPRKRFGAPLKEEPEETPVDKIISEGTLEILELTENYPSDDDKITRG